MSEQAPVFIGVGSNIDPEENVPRALEYLARHITLTAVSTFYRTAPIARPEQDSYLNGVVAAMTHMSPRALKTDILCSIELTCGRTHTEDKYAARTIDLDLLLYGNPSIHEPALKIPHPDIRERSFVSVALYELAPDIILPDTQEPLSEVVRDQMDDMQPDGDFTRRLRERLKL